MTTPDADMIRAKHQLASADTTGDDHAEAMVDRAARARKLVAERNDANPSRVGEIDQALTELGYTDPLPTTEAQRREVGPAGRTAPGPDAKAASEPRQAAKPTAPGDADPKPAKSTPTTTAKS